MQHIFYFKNGSMNGDSKGGKGHYYKFHNIKNQKEHWKICEPSLHRKSLFSWSLLQHHYIENGFLVDHYYYNQNIKNGFLVHHYIENHCLFSSSLLRKSERKKNVKRTSKVSVLSDFHILTTYGVSIYGILVLTKTF